MFKNQLGYVNIDIEKEEVRRLIDRPVPIIKDNSNNNLIFAVIEGVISQASHAITNRSSELQNAAIA